MNDITDFEKEYKTQLDNAIADADMPSVLLDQFTFESCIRKDEDGKKELYIVTRKSDMVPALLRITMNYSEEDALAEAKLLKMLDYPGIPKVYETYSHHGRNYIVREYFVGHSLYDVINTNGVLQAKDIFDIALKLCDILAYLHGQTPPIIHRDIKPQNIIITPNGGVHLIDFGIARLHKPGQQQDTAIILTGRYAPPEQFGYDQTSPLTDIYALGVAMLFLATGREEKTGLERQIKNKHLRRLIERCIAFDPKARFQSVQSIAQYIRRNTGEKKNRRRALFALLLVGIAACAAVPSYFFGYRAGEADGQKIGYENGYSDGYGAGHEDAPSLGMAETPFDPSIGNLQGNMSASDSGFAARSENEIFYIGDDGIYRMNPDTTKAQLLVQVKGASSLNYYKGWLYYSTAAGIYRINPATNETEMFSEAAGKLYIVENQFYLRNAMDSMRLYKIDPVGGDAQRLNNLTQYYYMHIIADRMYFTDHNNDRKLYSCNLDGSDLRLVYNDTCEWISIYDGQIYCFALGENGEYLTRMNLDGGNAEGLLRDAVNYINVTPGGIFYTRGNERTLEWMSLDGKTRYTISPHKVGGFNIAGGWIFYKNSDDNDALWRVRIDGTDDQRISANSND